MRRQFQIVLCLYRNMEDVHNRVQSSLGTASDRIKDKYDIRAQDMDIKRMIR